MSPRNSLTPYVAPTSWPESKYQRIKLNKQARAAGEPPPFTQSVTRDVWERRNSVSSSPDESVPRISNGRNFAVYKPTNSKTFRASFLYPNGEKEDWDTSQTLKTKAVGAARGRLQAFKSRHNSNHRVRASIPRWVDESELKPVESTNNVPDSHWRAYETRCALTFVRLTELLLLGAMDDPPRFIAHVRALVLETMEGARKPQRKGKSQ